MSSIPCPKCNKLTTEDAVVVEGRSYHPQCFTCCKCKNTISGSFFTEPQGFMCADCTGGAVYGDKRCSTCGVQLEGEFRKFKGREYCAKCVKSAQEADIASRRAGLGNVVAEEHRVKDQNQRLADQARNGGNQTDKFSYSDYHQSHSGDKKW